MDISKKKKNGNTTTYESGTTATDSMGYEHMICLAATYNFTTNLLFVSPTIVTKDPYLRKLEKKDYREIYRRFDNFITNCELYWDEPHEDFELRSPFNDNTNITPEEFKDAIYWCYVELPNPEKNLKDMVDQLCLEIMCDL